MAHLWEIDHDYYGPEGSYWARPDHEKRYQQDYESWQEFIDEGGMSSASTGMNLLYRWDWRRADPADGDQLLLFWMMPRKGIMATSTIEVTEADEPAVIAWLEPHAKYMRDLWSPLLDD